MAPDSSSQKSVLHLSRLVPKPVNNIAGIILPIILLYLEGLVLLVWLILGIPVVMHPQEDTAKTR